MRGIITLCLIIVYSLTFSQTVDGQADSLRTSELSEVVVSANRWEQELAEVPATVRVVSNSLVKFQNPQTAADLLNLSGNVFIQKSQLGGGSPMIRGFATNRVMIVVDGVRMNNAIFRSGNVQNVISLDAHAIQEAEIVFGPGAVMYGSDAIGGVMDFHTLKPAYSTTQDLLVAGNAMVRYATANREQSLHADVNVASRKLSLLSSITRSVYDDLRMGSNGPDDYTRPDFVRRVDGTDVVINNDDENVQVGSGYDQWNTMHKLAYKANQWFSASYAFHLSATSDYGRYDRLILREEGALANAQWYYGPQEWIMHSLQLDYSRPSAISDRAKLIVAYQDYEESRHNRGFGSSGRTDRAEEVNALSANLDLDKAFSETFSLFYGAEFVTNEVNSVGSRENINTGVITPVSTRYPDGSTWRTAAVYANGKADLSKKVVLNAGIRYTNVATQATFDRTFFDFQFSEASLGNNALNGSLGVVFNPNLSWKIFGNLSTGFRAPNVDDIGKVFDSEPGNVVVPNPDLKPEYAYNAEAGLTGVITPQFRLEAGAYYTLLDNAIARGPTLFNGQDSIDYDGELSRVLSQQNISEVRIAGIQAGITWAFGDGFSLRSTINYQKGKERDPETNRDVPPTHVAPMFGQTHLRYSKLKLRGEVYMVYNGAIKYEDLALSERADSHLYAEDPDGNPYSPSWMTLNAKFSYSVSKHLTIDAGVENIFDKRYRPYSSGITAPGRNFIFALRGSI